MPRAVWSPLLDILARILQHKLFVRILYTAICTAQACVLIILASHLLAAYCSHYSGVYFARAVANRLLILLGRGSGALTRYSIVAVCIVDVLAAIFAQLLIFLLGYPGTQHDTAWERYVQWWTNPGLANDLDPARPLIDQIVWPTTHGGPPEGHHSVIDFFANEIYDLAPNDRRQLLRHQLAQWHPDALARNFGSVSSADAAAIRIHMGGIFNDLQHLLDRSRQIGHYIMPPPGYRRWDDSLTSLGWRILVEIAVREQAEDRPRWHTADTATRRLITFDTESHLHVSAPDHIASGSR